jgi:hydrogenase maturation protein HypF
MPGPPPSDGSPASPRERQRVAVSGAVQGVGFRPHVYRLARELGVTGWVANHPAGAVLEAEGSPAAVAALLDRLAREVPPGAVIHHLERRPVPCRPDEPTFEIRHSDQAGTRTAVVLPDRVTCAACQAEVADPTARRFRYPFTNCTHCGPRFTIVEALPYDRPNTTMAGFPLCADCRREYEDPDDRRFHAQPIACPACGPQLAWLDAAGHELARREAALAAAVEALTSGAIVAVLGIGGFQLLCDATDEAAVSRLRARKRRPDKPLAVLVRDLAMAATLAEISAAEAALLASPEGPIVLLARRRPGHAPDAASPAAAPAVAEAVAPGQTTLGLLLPTTPLHTLLAAGANRPLVATSGNLSDEPIAISVAEGLDRLAAIADHFLVHDRPLARHVDDSVARHLLGDVRILRRARGWAPFPLLLGRADDAPAVLAVGAHLKNTVGLLVGNRAFTSQHLGDMETAESRRAFARVIADLVRLYEATPALIVHDLHPDYPTTHWARERAARDGLPLLAVQHHHAHFAACLAEHGLLTVPGHAESNARPGGGSRAQAVRPATPALGVLWDGTGYGPDGTVWGGELLLGDAASARRVARLRPFRLPGGEAAVREPRRVALALLWELFGPAALDHPAVADLGFGAAEPTLLGQLLARGTAAPVTSSAGRLFDGVAALLGLFPRVSFEGQAAIALERLADAANADGDGGGRSSLLPDLTLGETVGHDGERADATLLELDWRPLVAALLAARDRGTAAAELAAAFHDRLATAAARVAERLAVEVVALSGGCFQNRRLTVALAGALERRGHRVLLHRQLPPNDGGIAFGQLAVAAAREALATAPHP